jgi:FkbM family methyltransferase
MNREHIGAQLVLRAWPFQRGVGRALNTFFPNTSFKESIAQVQTTDSVSIKVFTNDLIGRLIYLTGEYERSTIEVLCKFSKPGDILLDIGANIGYVSCCFLGNVSGSKVIAVEPQPEVLDLLESNLAQFGDRSSILPFAISDRDGTSNFVLNPENRGNARLAEAEGHQNAITVETRTAATLATDGHLGAFSIVKIDVEGHEEQVIRSLLPVLRTVRPRAILFEEGGSKAAPDGQIGIMLGDLGYETFGIRKRLFSNRLIPIRRSADCRCDNYVAVLARLLSRPSVVERL